MKKITVILIIFVISVTFIGLIDNAYAKGGSGGGRGSWVEESSSATDEEVYSPTPLRPASAGSSNPINNSNIPASQKIFTILF